MSLIKWSMKQNVSDAQFAHILSLLSQQSGEEKLRIAFHLSDFVKQLRKQGEQYGKRKSTIRPRATT